MPILKTGATEVDYLDAGQGPAVVLVHSAASNNRQWRRMIEDYSHQYRFLALNLHGYGDTPPWPADRVQTIEDQAQLVLAVSQLAGGPVHLVGHSFGGAVAAAAAVTLAGQLASLVLLEANPFPLLDRPGCDEAWQEVLELRDFIRQNGARGDWQRVAEFFVNYWLGEGAWAALPADRREVFTEALPNNYHEWDAVMNMDVSASAWQKISAPTLLVKARQTPRPVTAMYEILRDICPGWQYVELQEGGHMAPVTHPELVNPVCMEFIGARLSRV